MKTAYIDTSCLLTVSFEEPGHGEVLADLEGYEELFSSNLLEAELRATTRREGINLPRIEALNRLIWLWPDRPLTKEFKRVLSSGNLKGADLWHLASALFLRDQVGSLDFLSLDEKQLRLAKDLDFGGPEWTGSA